MKSLFIIAALIIAGLVIYNTQIKNRQIMDINITKIRDELNITRDGIKNPTDLMRNGVEIPLATMCEKANGILFAGKCYEDKNAKPKEDSK
jgi:hypothetical protein